MGARELELRPAGERDLPLLAAMNRRLIEDEGSRNPMSLAELEGRFRALVAEGWRLDLFVQQQSPVGYALYQLRRDQYDASRQVVFLRHFYVERAERGQGLGRRAFQQLAASRFPPESTVQLDVLATNPAGLAFWRRLGFAPYATTLTLDPGHAN